MANATSKKLRKDINRASDGVEDGAVITFRSDASDGRTNADGTPFSYLYGAIYIAATRRWYLTSAAGWFGKNNFTHSEFVDRVLVHKDVHSVRVATAFEEV